MTQPPTPEDPGTAQKHREGVTLAETRRSSMPDKQTQNNRGKAFLGNILIMPILCYIESSEDEDLTEDENCSQEGTFTGLLLSLLPGAKVTTRWISTQFSSGSRPIGSHLTLNSSRKKTPMEII